MTGAEHIELLQKAKRHVAYHQDRVRGMSTRNRYAYRDACDVLYASEQQWKDLHAAAVSSGVPVPPSLAPPKPKGPTA